MNKSRFKKYIFTVLPVSIILGAVAISAITNGGYWFGFIAIAWLGLILFRQYSYFSKAESELLAAPKEARRGMWKVILTLFLTAFISVIAFLYLGFSETYIQYFSIALGILLSGYILWRHFMAFRKAKLIIKSRKALEATNKNMNND